MNFILEIIKVNGTCPWAIRAIVDGEKRYRGYHYKKEAVKGLPEWQGFLKTYFYREFYHNFSTAEELGIVER